MDIQCKVCGNLIKYPIPALEKSVSALSRNASDVETRNGPAHGLDPRSFLPIANALRTTLAFPTKTDTPDRYDVPIGGITWHVKDGALGYEAIEVPDPDCFAFLKGDIMVMESCQPCGHGHVAGYDGCHWISDFVQRDFWAGPGYRKKRPVYAVYRYLHPGVTDGSGTQQKSA